MLSEYLDGGGIILMYFIRLLLDCFYLDLKPSLLAKKGLEKDIMVSK